MTASVSPGIRRTKHGWQVYVTVRGEFVSKHFPAETPLAFLRDYRDALRARALAAATPDPFMPTLAQYYAGCALTGAIAGGMADPELIADWAMTMGNLLASKFSEPLE
jgi:hypothetical protein